jgi:malate dehydrogenase (quinone)
VHDESKTRFGPTAKVLFMLERRNYASTWDYFAALRWTPKGIASFFVLLADRTTLPYVTKNFLYDVPLIGKRLFIKNAQKIVPSIRARDIHKERGYGGTRPQIVDTRTMSMALGEARLTDTNLIVNITPSPGASTCLQNAWIDSQQIVAWLGTAFHEKQFSKHLR